MEKILFGIVIIIAIIGLVLNLDLVLFGIFKSIIMLIVMIAVIYLIYFFFFLTPDQRNYKLRVWKNRYRRRR
ncbi:SA1362 family protein [Staphylococcus coagulans]|uniref:SA1362 family protein n=1 Tax=Staphylococcus coagulans TaxID=74706 RepID=UPI0028728CA3|nr:SA1362 family protein [Staphylococcus coagulans]MDR9831885.1 SA1362 family protein [Staphylococcus coagulans]